MQTHKKIYLKGMWKICWKYLRFELKIKRKFGLFCDLKKKIQQ